MGRKNRLKYYSAGSKEATVAVLLAATGETFARCLLAGGWISESKDPQKVCNQFLLTRFYKQDNRKHYFNLEINRAILIALVKTNFETTNVPEN